MTNTIQQKKPSLFFKVVRTLLLTILLLGIIIICLLFYGKHYLDTNPDVQDDLIQRASESFGVPIKVSELGVGWSVAGPEITAKDLSFYPVDDVSQTKPILAFENTRVALDLKGYIRSRVLNVAEVQLSGSELVLQKVDEQWLLNGHALDKMDIGKNGVELSGSNENAESFRLPKGQFNVDGISLVYLNKKGEEAGRFDELQAMLDNDGTTTHLQFNAENNPLFREIKLSAKSDNQEKLSERNWSVLFEADNIVAKDFLRDWSRFQRILAVNDESIASATENIISIENGFLDIKLWGNSNSGNLDALNGDVKFTDLQFTSGYTNPVRFKTIPELSFRLLLDRQYREMTANEQEKYEQEKPALLDAPENEAAPQFIENNTFNYVQEEVVVSLSDLVLNSDTGLWPKADIHIKRLRNLNDTAVLSRY